MALGSIPSKTADVLVIAPVCQCSSNLPVVNTKGNLSSGISAGDTNWAGTIFPLPSSVGYPSTNIISLPGSFGDSQG